MFQEMHGGSTPTPPEPDERWPEPDRILEARLAADEQRLSADESLERSTRRISLTGAVVAGVLVVAVVALVLAIAALRRDVHAIQVTAPAGSVSTDSLRDSAVTSGKLAPGAVGPLQLRADSVTARVIAAQAVGGAEVAGNALTGADVLESSLGRVPLAASAQHAENATRLDGELAAAFLLHARTVHAASATTIDAVKGPVVARCPANTRVIGGGTTVKGALRGIAVVTSAPTGDGWTALVRRSGGYENPWRVVVTALCASGGS